MKWLKITKDKPPHLWKGTVKCKGSPITYYCERFIPIKNTRNPEYEFAEVSSHVFICPHYYLSYK